MHFTVDKLSPVLVELNVQVPADQVRTEVRKAYDALQRTARVRGYRPGKAPRQVLTHLFADRIHADVAQRLLDTTFNQALADGQVMPLTQPAFAPGDLDPESEFTYKARFEVRPEIEKVNWEGFALSRPSTKATAELVDAELERLRLAHATLQAPAEERPAKDGDVVTLAFTLAVDGQVRGEATPQEVETEVGKGQVFAEIDAALAGMTVGATKEVVVAFPEAHASPDLRGKQGTFAITLKDLKERVLPSLDDEFAKDCEAESLEALRKSASERIEKELEQKATDALAEQIVVALCKENPIPVPPSLVEQQAQLAERELLAAARRQGQRIDPNADIRARLRADAEMKVRAGLLMAEIAKTNEVKVTEQDLEKGYEELAAQRGKNVAKIKAEYRDAQKREMLVGMVLEDKILDLIEGKAQITDAG